MRSIPFKAKVWRQGDSWVVTIPADYINQGLIPKDQELQFNVEVSG